FTACRQAVADELSHQQPSNGKGHSNGAYQQPNGTNGHAKRATNGAPPKDRTRRATASQARALHAITERQGIDLAALAHDRHGCAVEELSILEASQLIDELKGTANGAGGRGS